MYIIQIVGVHQARCITVHITDLLNTYRLNTYRLDTYRLNTYRINTYRLNTYRLNTYLDGLSHRYRSPSSIDSCGMWEWNVGVECGSGGVKDGRSVGVECGSGCVWDGRSCGIGVCGTGGVWEWCVWDGMGVGREECGT